MSQKQGILRSLVDTMSDLPPSENIIFVLFIVQFANNESILLDEISQLCQYGPMSMLGLEM